MFKAKRSRSQRIKVPRIKGKVPMRLRRRGSV